MWSIPGHISLLGHDVVHGYVFGRSLRYRDWYLGSSRVCNIHKSDLPGYMVDDRGEIGGAIKLYTVKRSVVSLENTLGALAVGVVRMPILLEVK